MNCDRQKVQRGFPTEKEEDTHQAMERQQDADIRVRMHAPAVE